jgi:hypothetical protein
MPAQRGLTSPQPVPAAPSTFPRHAGEGRHPRLSLNIPSLRRHHV